MDIHKAYSISHSFNQNLIESIEAYENIIIIGTKIGQLFMYSIPWSDTSHQKKKLESYHETEHKKPICQMKVVPEEQLLFVLANSVIYVYDISNSRFHLMYTSEETKGCNIFAMKKETIKSEYGQVFSAISLCVGIKRILRFFYWGLNRLTSIPRLIQLKRVAKSLTWIQDTICIGFKDEYVIYIYNNTCTPHPEKFEFDLATFSHNRDPLIYLTKNTILGIVRNELLIFIDANNFSKTNEFLAKNFLRPISWNNSVLDLTWDEPYLIGCTGNSVEVHVLEGFGLKQDTLIQTIPDLFDVRFLVRSGSGHIVAASLTKVWCISMVDIPTQRVELLPQKKFKLAIELTKISNEPEKLKENIIQEIRSSYAKELFAKKKFFAAMDEFKKTEVEPYDVIRLFPPEISGESSRSAQSPNLSNMPELEGKELKAALLALIDYLVVARHKEISRSMGESAETSLVPLIDTVMKACYLRKRFL